MKKIFTIFLIGLLVICGFGASAIEEETKNFDLFEINDGTISVIIQVETVDIEKTINGDKISIDGFGQLLVTGKPKMPSKIISIAIPPGARLVDINYEVEKEVILPGNYQIIKAQPPDIELEKKKDSKLFEIYHYKEDYENVYNSNNPYPSSIIEYVQSSGYRKYNLVDVRVNPATYYPLDGKLIYYPEIKIDISYTFEVDFSIDDIINDNIYKTESFAKTIIYNYEKAKDWYLESDRGRQTYDYVIITLDSLTSYIDDLVAWEEAKGKNVFVATTDWIDLNYEGYDLAEKMRNFLREKYPSEQWGIQDLIIIGHRDDIPMRLTWQDIGGGKPETDYYYAELSLPDNESWDADGDHQYGEDSDPIDFYGEINVGRIPWSDPLTVQHICEKSVIYEQNNDPSFKNNILLLAAFIDSNTDGAVFMEYSANKSIHPWMAYFMKTRLYEFRSSYEKDYILTHQNVVDIWSSGKYGFVSWHAHGSPNGCSFITVDDCDLLNDDYPAIISAASCSNSDTDYLNIGQAMMKKGAVGFLGANKAAYYCSGWDDPNDGSDQSFKYFFKSKVTSGDYTQGQAHQYAISEMYERGLWYDLKYETFIHGSLWGNPDLGMNSLSENDPPEKPMQALGPLNGKVGVEYFYSSSTTDPNNEELFYLFDWGDGTNSGWFGPYISGGPVEASHTWSDVDNFEIKIIAQDINGTKSVWSDPVSVEIPRLKTQTFKVIMFEWLFERFANAIPFIKYILGQ
ncbi:MAG: hypothetical protein JSU91_00495 [Thermoplasmatales archaeon]|nr:MAG: hypothetical protein JSU91_00495 [Thermoplasmatales archaeon]